jgi:hypothetical protein
MSSADENEEISHCEWISGGLLCYPAIYCYVFISFHQVLLFKMLYAFLPCMLHYLPKVMVLK